MDGELKMTLNEKLHKEADLSKFFESVLKGDQDSVLLSIKDGVDVNAFNKDDQTALMIASNLGNLKMAQLLIEQGAQVNLSSDYGRTALSYAISGWNRSVKMVELLVNNGADINERTAKKDGFYTLRPLTLATLYGGAEIVHFLLEKGAQGIEEAKIFAKNQGNNAMLDILEEKNKMKGNNLLRVFKYLIYAKDRQKN